MATAGETRSSIEQTPLDRGSFWLAWLAALATYGVGDGATTIAIVYFAPLVREANPVVLAAFEAFGSAGFLALKLSVFAVCLWISVSVGARSRDRLLGYGPPLLLAGAGAVVTANNLSLILA